MGDMRSDHKQAIIANARDTAPFNRAGVHGDMFADLIALTDNQARHSAFVMCQMLRMPAQDRKGWTTEFAPISV